jgi:hypothetical protein
MVAGVAMSVTVSVHTSGGRFHKGVGRVSNTSAFFTIQSNLLMGLGCFYLARTRTLVGGVRGDRLTGLVAIMVTGLVYHVALSVCSTSRAGLSRPISSCHGGSRTRRRGVGAPRAEGLNSARVVGLSLLLPLACLAFTLVRGAEASVSLSVTRCRDVGLREDDSRLPVVGIAPPRSGGGWHWARPPPPVDRGGTETCPFVLIYPHLHG